MVSCSYGALVMLVRVHTTLKTSLHDLLKDSGTDDDERLSDNDIPLSTIPTNAPNRMSNTRAMLLNMTMGDK